MDLCYSYYNETLRDREKKQHSRQSRDYQLWLMLQFIMSRQKDLDPIFSLREDPRCLLSRAHPSVCNLCEHLIQVCYWRTDEMRCIFAALATLAGVSDTFVPHWDCAFTAPAYSTEQVIGVSRRNWCSPRRGVSWCCTKVSFSWWCTKICHLEYLVWSEIAWVNSLSS